MNTKEPEELCLCCNGQKIIFILAGEMSLSSFVCILVKPRKIKQTIARHYLIFNAEENLAWDFKGYVPEFWVRHNKRYEKNYVFISSFECFVYFVVKKGFIHER
jgi:hypothetical protein